jgi:hypothetical protein
MGILCLVCIWHAMIAKMIYECTTNNEAPYNTEAFCSASGSTIATSDSLALAVLASIYVLFHIIFVIFIRRLVRIIASLSNQFTYRSLERIDCCYRPAVAKSPLVVFVGQRYFDGFQFIIHFELDVKLPQ